MRRYLHASLAPARLPSIPQQPFHAACPPKRVQSWLLFLLAFLPVLVGVGGAPLAHAAPLVDAFSPLPPSGEGTPPLAFQGGWIQQHPTVYLVFWGPKWDTDSTHIAIRNQVIATFDVLAGGHYNNILTQYHNPTDPTNPENLVHNDISVAASLTDSASPPSVPLDIGVEVPGGLFGIGEIRSEVEHALKDLLQVQPDRNTQVLVFPQQGTTYALPAACGMHSYDSYVFAQPFTYSYARYADDGSNCNFTGDIPQSTAWTAVHEYAETATDPHIYLTANTQPIHGSGWNTGEAGVTGPHEVADLCANYEPGFNYADLNQLGQPQRDVWDSGANGGKGQFYQDPSGHYLHWPTYAPTTTGLSLLLPFLWSNFANGCVMSAGQEYASPDSTGPFTNKHTVQGLILTKYQGSCSNVGACANLGAPLTEETPIAGGHVSYFAGQVCNGGYTIPPTSQNGGVGLTSGSAIYYSTGPLAYEVHGCIFLEYASVMGGPGGQLGFPVSDEQAVATGRVSYFSNGSPCVLAGPSGSASAIYYSSSVGTHEVRGCIYYHYWHDLSGPAGLLGFPSSDELSIAGGAVSYFSNGAPCIQAGPSTSASAIYSSNVGTNEVRGCIYYRYWHDLSGPSGVLGFPTSDELAIPGGGAVSYFSNGQACSAGLPYGSSGAIYAGGRGIWEVHGCIYAKYLSLGAGPAGLLGFPISDEQGVKGGRVSYFAGQLCGAGGPTGSGSAIYASAAGIQEVHGCIYATYASLGGPFSKLGFPVTDEFTNAVGHRESDFQNGFIWFDGQSHVVYYCSAVPVNGCI